MASSRRVPVVAVRCRSETQHAATARTHAVNWPTENGEPRVSEQQVMPRWLYDLQTPRAAEPTPEQRRIAALNARIARLRQRAQNAHNAADHRAAIERIGQTLDEIEELNR
jgi:hypothetical protein